MKIKLSSSPLHFHDSITGRATQLFAAVALLTMLAFTHTTPAAARDVNGDGIWGPYDPALVAMALLGTAPAGIQPDVTGDGVLSVSDLIHAQYVLLGYRPDFTTDTIGPVPVGAPFQLPAGINLEQISALSVGGAAATAAGLSAPCNEEALTVTEYALETRFQVGPLDLQGPTLRVVVDTSLVDPSCAAALSPGDAFCAAVPDGLACAGGGSLVSCDGGYAASVLACPGGCVEDPSPACAPDLGDALCGQLGDGVHCRQGALATCSGGAVTTQESCLDGCLVVTDGPDLCVSGVGGDPCVGRDDGDWCAGDILAICQHGALTGNVACSLGCEIRQPDDMDECVAEPSTGFCSDKADGSWCSGEVLVDCLSGQIASQRACAGGCLPQPVGVDDRCANDGFCAAPPPRRSTAPPDSACAYMDWGLSPDGWYLVSTFGTTADLTTLGNTTSCGYLQGHYDVHGCLLDQQTGTCGGGDTDIPWVQGHVDYDYDDALALVAAFAGEDVPAPELFYVAGAQRFGCGATLRVSNPATGRCVVAYVEDGGPGSKYEGSSYGGRRILDASPAVTAWLGVTRTGWGSGELLAVEWGQPGDVPGERCSPCESALVEAGTKHQRAPWDLRHMVPSCGSGATGSCPGGSGLYCGTGGLDPSSLYYCAGGEYTLHEACEHGCLTQPAGTPDVCLLDAAGCPDDGGLHCGGALGLDPGHLYGCEDGAPVIEEECAASCEIVADGQDRCDGATCMFGDGRYCGESIGMQAGTLYSCADGLYTVIEECGAGCQQNPPGTHDACAQTGHTICVSGDGAYCGESLGLTTGTLYWCSGGSATITTVCQSGCQQNPAGAHDACADGAGTLTMCNPFSPPRSITTPFGGYSGHNGSDYSAGEGVPVFSPIGGVVLKVVRNVPGQTCSLSFGNYVRIRYGIFEVILAHLGSDIQVDEGAVVQRGQLIGSVSNSGYTLTQTTPGVWECQHGGGFHLHLELRVNGVPVDIERSSYVRWSESCDNPPAGFCVGREDGDWCEGAALVSCQGGVDIASEVCDHGCEPGTPDECAPAPLSCPSGNGAYCGSSVGLSADTLYQCTNGTFSVIQTCTHGCEVMPTGTSDACAPPPPSCPSGNGAYCGSTVGLSANTLYQCTNGTFSAIQSCTYGCEVMPAGTSDACAPPPPSCPSGNGAYCGSTVGLSANTLYQCTNGTFSVIQTCAHGCEVMPTGTSDACAPPPPSCPSGNGAYCGSTVGLSANTLYQCTDGTFSAIQSCAYGCEVMPAGTSDACAPPPPSCPSGNGAYCGSTVGLSANKLYQCTNGTFSVIQTCTYGCDVMPAGTSDACAPPPPSCPSGNGAYCGSTVGLSANKLYQCTNGTFSVIQTCTYGCEVMPAGTSDRCASATCPSGDGAYCGGSVGLDTKTLYDCAAGVFTPRSWCASGCRVAAAGQNDSCYSGTCPYGNGAYCGQTVGLPADLYWCSNGVWTVTEDCAGSCVVAPPGAPDYCP